MITIGYSGLFILVLVCMVIGGIIFAMCRVSGDCSREEELHRREGSPPADGSKARTSSAATGEKNTGKRGLDDHAM
ncbi:MAG: hypothetical protein H6Q76_748 [Firmicutes bacterium]|nr:hypothetical protein [Bacillota bacterium]